MSQFGEEIDNLIHFKIALATERESDKLKASQKLTALCCKKYEQRYSV